jgi:DNA-binding PadR family transcriptional regulator
MDDDTLNLLKTVCAAGRARASYNGSANERLEKLVEEGLLSEVSATHAGASSKSAPRRQYQPTEQGRAMLRHLNEKGAA